MLVVGPRREQRVAIYSEVRSLNAASAVALFSRQPTQVGVDRRGDGASANETQAWHHVRTSDGGPFRMVNGLTGM
jgi:hypothetical protein